MSNIIQTFPKGGSPTYAGLPDKPTVNNIDIEALSIEGMDVVEDTTNNVTEISAPGLNADSIADVLDGEIGNNFATSAFNYSTNEQIVGRWIDGKPIYQKTISGTFNNASPCTVSISTGTSNIKQAIDLRGGVYHATTNSGYYLPYPGSNFDQKLRAMYFDGDANQVKCQSYVPGDKEQIIYVTLQYTKTTDT